MMHSRLKHEHRIIKRTRIGSVRTFKNDKWLATIKYSIKRTSDHNIKIKINNRSSNANLSLQCRIKHSQSSKKETNLGQVNIKNWPLFYFWTQDQTMIRHQQKSKWLIQMSSNSGIEP